MEQGPSKQKQFSVALSPELRAQLERASEAAGHSVAEEIRRRLERTLTQDAIDPVTREAAEAFVTLATAISTDLDKWHRFVRPNQALAAAVAQRIAAYAVGAPESSPGPFFSPSPFGADTDPAETIGRTHERHDRRIRRYPHLEAAQRTNEWKFGVRRRDKEGKDEK